MQEPVLELGALDLDEIGELEYAFERARRNALVQDFAGVLFRLALLFAADRERVFLQFDIELVLAEAGNRDRDAVGVLAGPLDIVGRIGRGGINRAGLVEQVE